MKAIKHHGETYSSDDLRYEGLVKKKRKERQGERITEETVMIWKGIFLMYSALICLFSCFFAASIISSKGYKRRHLPNTD